MVGALVKKLIGYSYFLAKVENTFTFDKFDFICSIYLIKFNFHDKHNLLCSASDFEVNRDIIKHESEDVLNISPLSCPAAIFFGSKSFSMKAISILN